MSTQVQFRRGTSTQNNAFTGALGEITVDTDNKTLRLHDGTTAGGGSTMATLAGSQTLTNKTLSTGSTWTGTAVGLAYGGTGSALSAVAGAVTYSGASGLALSAAGTTGQVLISGGTNSPTWTSAVSLAVGGTGVALTAVAGGVTYSTSSTLAISAAGTTGQLLQSNGASAPSWITPTYASTGKSIAMAIVFGG